MRIIAKRTIAEFIQKHPETEVSLSRWVATTDKAQWSKVDDVQKAFSGAKASNGERVRFEVAGGNYRMIVAFQFRFHLAFIKFLGTHAEFDKIDALTVSQF